MATKALSDFLPDILPHVADCPEPIAEHAVRTAAIQLCERAKIWRYELDPITLAPGVAEYDLSFPANTYVVDALRVRVGGDPIEGKTREDLDADKPGWMTQRGEVFGYFLTVDKRKIRVVYTPAAVLSNGLQVEVALKPSRAVTTLEEFIYEEYLNDIAEGAKAILFGMKDQKWTSAARREDAEGKFNEACGRESVDSARSHSRAPLRTRAVYSIE